MTRAVPWLLSSVLVFAGALGGCSSDSLTTLEDAADVADMAVSVPPPDMLCTLTVCGASCVDVTSDPLNCGACGKTCASAETCHNSQCIVKPCTKDSDCSDGLACSVDQCLGAKCIHNPGPADSCPMGMVCDPSKGGCVAGAPPIIGPNLCAQAPPAGATLAPAPPKYKGTCPQLVPVVVDAMGNFVSGRNTIMSSGSARDFLLVVPKDLKPDENLPILFAWHWLGGSEKSFLEKGELQAAADQQRFLAIAPAIKRKANGDKELLFNWPFTPLDTDARIAEEVQFFDDMYACVAEQYKVNKECISSVGVSAGALWTDQLVQRRSNVLASAISLSGGTGGLTIRPWTTPPRHVPMTVLWGGMSDVCIVINFQDASHDLETHLVQDGAFFVECVHNCKHGEPPLEPPPGVSKYSSIWQFAFDHPFWLPEGTSPYQKIGLPQQYPTWCAIGKGNAVERTGMCPPPGC
jgi:predicted esterase